MMKKGWLSAAVYRRYLYLVPRSLRLTQTERSLENR